MKIMKFIGLDKNEYVLETEINKLNGRHMWTLNEWRDCYSGSKLSLNTVIKDIKENCQIIETY